MKTISLTELQARLQSEPRPALVEALPEQYFLRGHLPGAVRINMGEARSKAPRLLPDQGAAIVVYCASLTCPNSDRVASELQQLGYTNVAVYKGGKAEWESAGNALQHAVTQADTSPCQQRKQAAAS